MAVVFHRGLTIPLWALAFCVVALAAPPHLMRSVTALLGIAVMASTMMAMVRWLRTSRPLVEVLPAAGRDVGHAGIIMTAGTRTRTLDHATAARTQEADDAVDLVRMDDDGGWQMAREPALTMAGLTDKITRGSHDTRS